MSFCFWQFRNFLPFCYFFFDSRISFFSVSCFSILSFLFVDYRHFFLHFVTFLRINFVFFLSSLSFCFSPISPFSFSPIFSHTLFSIPLFFLCFVFFFFFYELSFFCHFFPFLLIRPKYQMYRHVHVRSHGINIILIPLTLRSATSHRDANTLTSSDPRDDWPTYGLATGDDHPPRTNCYATALIRELLSRSNTVTGPTSRAPNDSLSRESIRQGSRSSS